MFVTFQTVKRDNLGGRCRNEHPITVRLRSIISFRPTNYSTQVKNEDTGEWKNVPLTRVEIGKGDTFEELLVVGDYISIRCDIDEEVVYMNRVTGIENGNPIPVNF